MSHWFRVQFGDVQNGWMPVELVAGREYLAFSASSVPSNSVHDLAGALIVLLGSDCEVAVVWSTEPAEYEFQFSSSSVLAKLEVIEFADSRRVRDQRRIVFTVEGSRREMVLVFWRSLRRLQSCPDFEHHWGAPFPHRDIELLGERLGGA